MKKNSRHILFATGNEHKASEIRAILPDGYNLLSLKDIDWDQDIPEPYDSLHENALHKARCLHEALSIPVMAEDSGLEVYALDGAPGVRTARYAGPHKSDLDNMRLLLRHLEGITDRRARFRSMICYITQDSTAHIWEGILCGHIAADLSGTGGFGYDPIFIPDDYTQTLAELPADIKHSISHRTRAFKQLQSFLQLS